MKNLMVKELPDVLQTLIKRLYPSIPSAPAMVYFNIFNYSEGLNWRDSTEEERLAYTMLSYTEGTIFKSAATGDVFVSTGHFKVKENIIYNTDSSGECDGVIYNSLKFAEIISQPEVQEQTCHLKGMRIQIKAYPDYIFKVGDSPEWTPEMIAAIPHGTVLSCAHTPTDKFTYNSQTLDICHQGICYYEVQPLERTSRMMWFTYKGKNAEVVSLPAKKEEFASGELVEVRINGWPEGIWKQRKYLAKNSKGKSVCETFDGKSVCVFDEIRRLQPDTHLKDLADKILSLNGFPLDTERRIINGDQMRVLLIEMGKAAEEALKTKSK